MALDPKVIRTLIFDLDDTLFDTLGQLVTPAARDACQAMIEAGLNASIDEALITREKFFKERPRFDLYRLLTEHFGTREGIKPQDVINAGYRGFYDRKIKEVITTFPDTTPTLQRLREKYRLYLVTLGSPETQKQKVELLKIKNLFTNVSLVNFNETPNKSLAFAEIMDEVGGPPESFLSIGNRMDSEIKEAKILGMQTILMLHGEYLHLKAQTDYEKPDASIKKLSELLEILK